MAVRYFIAIQAIIRMHIMVHKYVMVCVKLVLARDTEIVPALPIVRVPHEMEDARGITLRENVLLLLLLISHS